MAKTNDFGNKYYELLNEAACKYAESEMKDVEKLLPSEEYNEIFSSIVEAFTAGGIEAIKIAKKIREEQKDESE